MGKRKVSELVPETQAPQVKRAKDSYDFEHLEGRDLRLCQRFDWIHTYKDELSDLLTAISAMERACGQPFPWSESLQNRFDNAQDDALHFQGSVVNITREYGDLLAEHPWMNHIPCLWPDGQEAVQPTTARMEHLKDRVEAALRRYDQLRTQGLNIQQ